MTAEGLLKKYYQDIYRQVAEQYSDIGERLKVGYASPVGIETGFLAGEQNRLSSEYNKYLQRLREQERTQAQILEEQRKQQEDAARKQRIANYLKVGGIVAGAMLAPLTGGMSMAAGASLGGLLGGVGGSLITGGEVPQFDFGFIDEWNKYRKEKKDKEETETQP